MADTVRINATITLEVANWVGEVALQNKRSTSNMISLILEEAMKKTKKSTKGKKTARSV